MAIAALPAHPRMPLAVSCLAVVPALLPTSATHPSSAN